MLEDIFPNLRGSGYQITSPRHWGYNCVAWAAGDATNRWWPSEDDRDHWPAGAPRVESLSAFRDAFVTLGYCVMQLANQAARRQKHEYIGTEHILLGLSQRAY